MLNAPLAASWPGTGAAAGSGPLVFMVSSQTSSGSTSDTSRRTRSQAMRAPSALPRSVRRASFSATRLVCAAGVGAGGGIAASSARSPSSSLWRSLTPELAIRNQPDRRAVRSTAPRTAVSETAPGWRRVRPSSLGTRLTARTASVLHPEADRGSQRAERLLAVDLLADFHVGERIADADPDADQLRELVRQPRKVSGAAGQDELADAQGAGLRLVELERGDELPRKPVEGQENGLPHFLGLLTRQTGRNRRLGQ